MTSTRGVKGTCAVPRTVATVVDPQARLDSHQYGFYRTNAKIRREEYNDGSSGHIY